MNKTTDPKLMKIAQACALLKTTPQVINAHIRRNNLKTYGESPRLVNIDEVAAVIAVGKRQKTGSTKSVDLHREFAVGVGSVLYCVVEVKRRVTVVDKMTQQVVEVKSAYDQSQWSGTKRKAGSLIQDIAEGNLSTNNDIAALIGAMAKMAKARELTELYTDLKELYTKYGATLKTGAGILPESALIPEVEETEEEVSDGWDL